MFDNIRLRSKLALIALLATLPGFVLLYLLISEKNIAIEFAEKEKLGNVYLRPLREIQQLVPLHRRYWIYPEFQSAERTNQASRSITGALDKLREVQQKQGSRIQAGEWVTRVESRWKVLEEMQRQGGGSSPEDAYRALSADIRALISFVGDDSNLILDPDLDTYYMMDATLLKMPSLQDLLSQLEDLGLRTLRKEAPTAEERTELIILMGNIRSTLDELERNMRTGFNNNPTGNLEGELLDPLQRFRTATENYLSRVDAGVVRPEVPTLTPTQLVDLGDTSRNLGFQLWDRTINQLDALLDLRIKGFTNRKIGALFGVALVILMCSALVLHLSGHFSDRVKTLAQVAGKIAENPQLNPRDEEDLEEIISGDEVGSLAGSVQEMAKRLSIYIGELRASSQKLEEYSAQLEDKVEERTAELKLKNVELEQTLGALKETQDRLVTQGKLASLGALTAGIAHEIKNPLNFINNFAELSVELIEELRDVDAKLKAALDAKLYDDVLDIVDTLEGNMKKIEEHGKRADRIVKGMLDHSRGKSGNPTLTDLNQLVGEYTKLAYHGLRAQDQSFNVDLVLDLQENLPPVMLVPQDISQVVLNIVNNGCYSADKKRREKGDGFSPTVRVTSRDLGEKLEVRIRDNGKGISRENLTRIFEPFYTTKPTGEGTGLGLSISYDIIVQGHGGEFRVESEEGEYAEFIIVLPKKTA